MEIQYDNENIRINATDDKKEAVMVHELCQQESDRVWDGGVFVCGGINGCGKPWQ